ncbi:MAG: CoA:oxalate CoA-transferase [Acidimicrobiales bacterium]|jgi:CoA:oxalate CoA-transferase
MMSAVQGIFEGLRVLDFTQVLAGPTATRLMVEMGAEVIKVEMTPAGDMGRSLPQVRDGRSGYHVQQNRGKRSICVDLKDPRGQQLVLDLLPQVDVMIQNFANGVIERLGFGYDVVSVINPRLIVCNMSAFGRTGPLKDHPGYDPIAQAYGGILHMLGYEDRPPVLAGISPGDVLTGVHSFGGVAAALYHRERTGRGQEVSVSLLDAYVTTHEVNWQSWSVSNGVEPIRRGNVHPVVGGVGVFAVGDGGYVVLAAVNDQQWRSTCEVMGRPELAADVRFETSAGRCENRDAINQEVSQWLSAQPDRDAVIAKLEARRVPTAPVLTLAEAATHPHLVESGAIRWVDDDVLGPVLVPGMPIKFSESPEMLSLAAQQLGQDNEYVTCDIGGRSPAQYQSLIEAGVLVHDQAT